MFIFFLWINDHINGIYFLLSDQWIICEYNRFFFLISCFCWFHCLIVIIFFSQEWYSQHHINSKVMSPSPSPNDLYSILLDKYHSFTFLLFHNLSFIIIHILLFILFMMLLLNNHNNQIIFFSLFVLVFSSFLFRIFFRRIFIPVL